MTANEYIEAIRKHYPDGFEIDIDKKYKHNLMYVSKNHKHKGLSEILKHEISLWSNTGQSRWFVRTRLELINNKVYSTEFEDFKTALKTFVNLVGGEVYYYETLKFKSSDILLEMPSLSDIA